MVANAMLSDMDRSVRGGRRSSSPETSNHQFHTQPVVEEQPKIAVQPPKQLCLQETSARVEKRTISELMESRPKFTNETVGFKPIADIWSFKKEELQNVVDDSSSMIECSSILNKFKILKALKMAKAAKAAVQPCPQLVQNIVRTGSETDDEQIQPEVDEEQDRQIDPVFQNVPNNEEVLSFVYKLLAERVSDENYEKEFLY